MKILSEEELIALKQSGKYPVGGYAPGNYMGRCSSCNSQFTGDKRAVQCEKCALWATVAYLRAELEAVKEAGRKMRADQRMFSFGMPSREAEQAFDALINTKSKDNA